MNKNPEVVKAEQNGVEAFKSGKTCAPDVDIYVNDNEILLVADMPGVGRENLSINLENNTLTIEGAFTAKFMGSCRRHEFDPADYHRVFTMPKGIDVENTTAEFRNGVLYLHLPKSAAVRPLQIAVNGG